MAIKIKPDSGVTWEQKAEAFKLLGKDDEAAKAHEKAGEIDPRKFGNGSIPVHIKMGPYDVSYNDYDPPTKWITDSSPIYAYSADWENNELKVTRTPIGMVYHAVSEISTVITAWQVTDIWITHLTDGSSFEDLESSIRQRLVGEGYSEVSTYIGGGLVQKAAVLNNSSEHRK